jgi:hypothetical protein
MTVGRASHPCGGAGKSHRADEHPRPVFPVLLTIDESAELLPTTRRAIYAMVERRQLPGVIRIRRLLDVRPDAQSRAERGDIWTRDRDVHVRVT